MPGQENNTLRVGAHTEAKMDFRIDPEFQSLMPAQTPEARNKLSLMIRTDLRIDPGVVLNIMGDKILADGHTRLEICKELNLKFPTVEIKIPSRQMAIQWIIDNQLGRRNLTDEQRAYFIGKKFLNEKQQQGGTENFSKGHNDLSGTNTYKKIAEEQHVSPKTVQRNAAFAEAVDQLPPKVKEAVLNGQVPETKKEIISGVQPILCKRCGRIGAIKDCPQCTEARQKSKPPKDDCPSDQSDADETDRSPASPTPKSGKPRFDESRFNTAYGSLTRVVDDRGNLMGKGQHHKRCQDILGEFIKEYQLWLKETA